MAESAIVIVNTFKRIVMYGIAIFSAGLFVYAMWIAGLYFYHDMTRLMVLDIEIPVLEKSQLLSTIYSDRTTITSQTYSYCSLEEFADVRDFYNNWFPEGIIFANDAQYFAFKKEVTNSLERLLASIYGFSSTPRIIIEASVSRSVDCLATYSITYQWGYMG